MDISETPILSPGQRFGQFEIIALIGSGGMGQVYRARHTTLEEDFAIKILHPAITQDPSAIFRLRVEARTAFHLKHPNILNIEEFNEAEGKFYMRMPLMRGTMIKGRPAVSLGDIVKLSGGRLGEGDAAIILHDVLSGLAFAHANGVIHRDIKPANILFNRDSAVISDFGLVRIVGEEFFRSRVDETVAVSKLGIPQASASSGSSSLIGTYNYMSPEQRMGREADERSDIYAVGLIALDMLTGRTSFGMKAPSRAMKGISSGWDAFLSKALEPDASERFQSAKEMLENLPSLRMRPVVMAGRSCPVPVARKRLGKSRLIFSVASLLLASCALAAVLWFSGKGQEVSVPVPSVQQAPETLVKETPPPVAPQQMGKDSIPVIAAEPALPKVQEPASPLPAVASSTPIPAPEAEAVIANPPPVAMSPSQMPYQAEPVEELKAPEPAPEPIVMESTPAVTTPVATPVVTKAKQAAPEPKPPLWLDLVLPNNIPLHLRRIEAGTFRYGSPLNEAGRVPAREITPREATIAKPFYIGIHEFTQGQYESLMGHNPSRFRSRDRPVEQVSYAALTGPDGFLDKLNAYLAAIGRGNLKARLPDEEEWEYACRAGTTAPYSSEPTLSEGGSEGDVSAFAQCDRPYGMSAKVGKLSPNAWGLFDMHGNVEEMTSDGVVRGGSWASSPTDCRSAARRNLGKAFRGDEKTGFRIVINDTNDKAKTAPTEKSR